MKTQNYIVLFCILILLIISGCVMTKNIKYDSTFRNKKPQSFEMNIYESTNLERPYRIIGIVEANAGKLHDVSDTLENLKDEARKMGGDALLDLTVESSKGRMIIKQPYGYTAGNLREKWIAKVIIWDN